MPKGKGYRDQFGLDGTMSAAGKKRMASQPKGNVTPGSQAPENVRPNTPSASRSVPGAEDPSKSSLGRMASKYNDIYKNMKY